MKSRAALALVICAVLISVASCADPPARSESVTQDAAVTSTSTSPVPVSESTTPPATETAPSSDTTTPVWQICTWTMYGLQSEPSVATIGQPATIWAFLYIEDFPTTDVITQLMVNGEMVAQQTVTVNFDEAWPFYFTYTPDTAGVLNISIRAILAVNAPFTALPGGDSCYDVLSSTLVVQA